MHHGNEVLGECPGQWPALGCKEEVLCLVLTLTYCVIFSHFTSLSNLMTTKSFKEKTDAITLLKPGTMSHKRH